MKIGKIEIKNNSLETRLDALEAAIRKTNELIIKLIEKQEKISKWA